jgi:hypothetical protein
MRASTHLRRPDKPYFGTAFAVATLVILVLMAFGVLFLIPALGPTQVCVKGFEGPVIDSSGNVIDPGHSIPENCSGSSDWTPLILIGAFAAVVAGGIWANIRQIRQYARRWSSPFYYPVIWTAVTGIFLFLVLYTVRGRLWVESHAKSCHMLDCVDSYSFSLIGSLVLWTVLAILAVPFLLSLRRAILLWRSPARFVYRRRRI